MNHQCTAPKLPAGTQIQQFTIAPVASHQWQILYQELRRGGAVPTKLDRWWCVSGATGESDGARLTKRRGRSTMAGRVCLT